MGSESEVTSTVSMPADEVETPMKGVRTRNQVETVQPAKCDGCERDFKPRRRGQRFCIPACRVRAWRKDRVLTREQAARRARGMAARRRPRVGSRENPLQVRRCPECRSYWPATERDGAEVRCAEHR